MLEEPSELALVHYVGVLRRQSRPMAFTVAAVCVVILALVVLQPKNYSSTAQLLFQEPPQGNVVETAPERRQVDPIPNELVILRSQSVPKQSSPPSGGRPTGPPLSWRTWWRSAVCRTPAS